MVDVSVIIVNYNSFDYTLECVTSVINQTQKVSIEIIVVDNKSDEFDIDRLLSLSNNIKVIINDFNLGFAKANNVGIKSANGNVILLLNNDTQLLNDAISHSYHHLVKDSQIGVLGCKLLNEDLSWQKSFYPFPTIKILLLRLFRINEPQKNENLTQKVDWVTGAFFMFKKKHLMHLKELRLSENFFMYCEDIQWCFNFCKINLDVVYYPQGEVIHFRGKSMSSDSDFDKKLKFYFPNLFKLLELEKGAFYSKLYFFILSLIHLTDFKDSSNIKKARKLIRIMISN